MASSITQSMLAYEPVTDDGARKLLLELINQNMKTVATYMDLAPPVGASVGRDDQLKKLDQQLRPPVQPVASWEPRMRRRARQAVI